MYVEHADLFILHLKIAAVLSSQFYFYSPESQNLTLQWVLYDYLIFN